MVSERILKRNGFDDQEINKGIIAGLLHDIATPALGDATKNIDPHNLHEEDFWQEAIGENGHRLLNNHEIGLEEMSDIIKNKGTYGIILDIADRITYVMKDLRQVALHPDISLHDDIDDELSEIARKNQDIGNIYRDVLFDESTHQVYFNDPDRLFRFLNLRGLLHFNLYQSPYAAGRDRLFSRLIEPLYTPTDPTIEKPLSPQTLRKMTDSELMEFLCERYGKSSPVYEFFSNEMVSWIPKFEQFTSVQEAEKKEKELQYDSNIVTLGVVSMRGFNTGTDYFVRSDDGSIIPFREAEPSSTAILQEMSEATKGVYLYYTSLSEESPFNSFLKEVFHSKQDEQNTQRRH